MKITHAKKKEVMKLYASGIYSEFLCLFVQKSLGGEYRSIFEQYLKEQKLLKKPFDTLESVFRKKSRFEDESHENMANTLRPMVLEQFLTSICK